MLHSLTVEDWWLVASGMLLAFFLINSTRKIILWQRERAFRKSIFRKPVVKPQDESEEDESEEDGEGH